MFLYITVFQFFLHWNLENSQTAFKVIQLWNGEMEKAGLQKEKPLDLYVPECNKEGHTHTFLSKDQNVSEAWC